MSLESIYPHEPIIRDMSEDVLHSLGEISSRHGRLVRRLGGKTAAFTSFTLLPITGKYFRGGGGTLPMFDTEVFDRTKEAATIVGENTLYWLVNFAHRPNSFHRGTLRVPEHQHKVSLYDFGHDIWPASYAERFTAAYQQRVEGVVELGVNQ